MNESKRQWVQVHSSINATQKETPGAGVSSTLTSFLLNIHRLCTNPTKHSVEPKTPLITQTSVHHTCNIKLPFHIITLLNHNPSKTSHTHQSFRNHRWQSWRSHENVQHSSSYKFDDVTKLFAIPCLVRHFVILFFQIILEIESTLAI